MNSPFDGYAIPNYREMAVKHRLSPLEHGNDLRLNEAGDDLDTMPDGRPMFGPDAETSALHYLLAGWCNNEPIMKQLFLFVCDAFSEAQQLLKRRDQVALDIARDRLDVDEFHSVEGLITGVQFGRDAYAGAVMVVLNNLLQRFVRDLGSAKRADDPCALVGGVSIAEVVKAASANFRHYDEWAKTEPPDTRQLPSIVVIAKLLNVPLNADGSRHPFGQNMCGPMLLTCSDNSFDTLERRVFEYARTVSGLPL